MDNVISVIVPVFNAERYVSECVQSVLDQNYSSWQLILVDDGSTDGSGAICRDFAERDERIKYIYTQNKGACNARNIGIECAIGDYIFFMDADDSIMPNALQLCIDKMESAEVDIVCASCRTLRENGKPYHQSEKMFVEDVVIDNMQMAKDVLTYKTLCSIWGKLYKKSIIDDVRFDINAKRGQDVLFLITLLVKSQFQILRCADQIYNYRILRNSLSHGKREHQIQLLRNLIENLELKMNDIDILHNKLAPYVSYAILYSLLESIQLQKPIKHLECWQRELINTHLVGNHLFKESNNVLTRIVDRSDYISNIILSFYFVRYHLKRLVKRIIRY